MFRKNREFTIVAKQFSFRNSLKLLDPISKNPLGYFTSNNAFFPINFRIKDLDKYTIMGAKQIKVKLLRTYEIYEALPNKNFTLNKHLGTLETNPKLTKLEYNFIGQSEMQEYQIRGNSDGSSFTIKTFSEELATIQCELIKLNVFSKLKILNSVPDKEAMLILMITALIHHGIVQSRKAT